jgi:hypothetical protein
MEQVKKSGALESYYCTLEQEVLREIACELKARISKYMSANNISKDDKNNLVSGLYQELAHISFKLPSYEYSDMGKLSEIDGFLKYVGNVVEDINDVKVTKAV